MEKLIPFIMCIIFIVIAFFLWKAAMKISSFAARRKILSYSRASEEATSVLLISYFGELSVLTNTFLPIKTTRGTVYTDVDNIVILPTCIAVVEVKSMNGQIFTGNAHKWHQSVRLKNGERKEIDFENPIIKNERHIVTLTQIFERENIPTPPIYNIVMFSSDKIVFSQDQPEAYTRSAAIEKMRALSKRGKKFTFKEKRAIIRAIKKYSTSAANARAHNAKISKMAAKAEK
ncbi:MAG: NERD domain-containing protein [Ruminococcaceae bacterium]|nr:NERD domain-containing protein [Oscillospiraceae bacterium]